MMHILERNMEKFWMVAESKAGLWSQGGADFLLISVQCWCSWIRRHGWPMTFHLILSIISRLLISTWGAVAGTLSDETEYRFGHFYWHFHLWEINTGYTGCLFCEGVKDSGAAVDLFTSDHWRRAQTSGAEGTDNSNVDGKGRVKNSCAPPWGQ